MKRTGEPVRGFVRTDKDCSLDIDLDAKVKDRLEMRTDGLPAIETCNCEQKRQAVFRTIWSGDDKGRRVITCPLDAGLGCGFKVWMDAPFPNQARRVINHMFGIIEQLEFENAVGLGMQNLNWVDYEVENAEPSQSVDN